MIISKRLNSPQSVFPQANDIYKVLLLTELIAEDKTKSEDLLIALSVSSIRQIDYYISAAQFLGLLNSNNMLTDIGHIVINQSVSTRLELIVFLILSSDIFYDYFFDRNSENVIYLLSDRYGLTESTSQRRLSTIKRWINWCDIVIKDYCLEIQQEEQNGYR